MVNTDGTDLHRLTATLPESDSARWSSDGSHLLFTGRQTADQALGLVDHRRRRHGPDPHHHERRGRDQEGDWSPDGSRIVYITLRAPASAPCVS